MNTETLMIESLNIVDCVFIFYVFVCLPTDKQFNIQHPLNSFSQHKFNGVIHLRAEMKMKMLHALKLRFRSFDDCD